MNETFPKTLDLDHVYCNRVTNVPFLTTPTRATAPTASTALFPPLHLSTPFALYDRHSLATTRPPTLSLESLSPRLQRSALPTTIPSSIE